MILRVLNLMVIGALILAAAYVYRIKYDSTVQAERLAKIRGEVRRERDTIAALRAEWSDLESPSRIEALAKRYLHLKPVTPTQFDKLNGLPDQPQLVKPDSHDPIGEVIENLEEPPPAMTGSIWPPTPAPAIAPSPAPTDAARTTAPAAAAPAIGTNAGAPAAKSGRLDR